MDRAEDGPADDLSVRISGTRNDGIPFLVESRDTRELEIRSRDEPFELGKDGVPVLLAFDVGAWFAAAGVDELNPDGGTITVNDDDNRDPLDRFEEPSRTPSSCSRTSTTTSPSALAMKALPDLSCEPVRASAAP